MYCSKCGQQIQDGATFCNNCGNHVTTANQQYNNKKNNNFLIILVILLIVILGIVVGYFILSSNKKEVVVNNKVGDVSKYPKEQSNDGYNYSMYTLSIEEFDGTGKYDFKLDNDIFTIEFTKYNKTNDSDFQKLEIGFKTYINGNLLFEDGGFVEELFEEAPAGEIYENDVDDFYCQVHKFGDIFIVDFRNNMMVTAFDKSGKITREIKREDVKDVEDYPTYYELINEKGIIIRGDLTTGMSSMDVIIDDNETVDVCCKECWPEGFDEQTIYSNSYIIENKSGVLNFEGMKKEIKTVGEFLEEYDCH